jgi:hypothetical protein
MTLLPRQTLSWQPKRSSKNFERFMLDDPETIALRVTVIGGQRYADDYTVIWRGLSIGRIMKASGVPMRFVATYSGR